MVRLDDDTLGALVEAIEHGREGCPRWIVTAASRAAVVDAATARGFVALTLDVYARARVLDDRQLDERSLLLIDERSNAFRAHAALLHAASRSARPHLLLTLRRGRPEGRPLRVREARAAYTTSRVDRDSPQVLELLARSERADGFAARGRHAAAERLLRDVAGALARRGAAAHGARINIRLGRLLADRGRTKAAFEALEDAARSAQSAESEALLIESRLWQATTRIADAALLDAEGLCRAVLERPHLPRVLGAWANAVLAETLLWQGRVGDLPDVTPEDVPQPVAAYAWEVRLRVLLARGEFFAAGLAAQVVGTHYAELTMQTAAGTLARAEETLRALVSAARREKRPLRAAWGRLLLIDALRRAGREVEANAQVKGLTRVASAAPALLRREIEARASGRPTRPARADVHLAASSAQFAIVLLRIAHDEEDDKAAIRGLLGRVASVLETSRVELLSNGGGPATRLLSIGEGLPTMLGGRVLEAALGVGPERQAGGWEMGVPIRFATRSIGAIVCRWPIDRAIPAAAAELMELAAVIMGPRLDALLATGREEAKAASSVPELLGVTDAIGNVRKAIGRAAAAPFNVLIEGESGVGKELAARAVHQLSARRERKFCDVNCAALPEDLLESELFGHARGAFSGAVVERAGLFEEADGGTLLLDEVADLSPRAQAKLLRAVQQQEVRRVGESFSRKIDVRIVAAANRDMRAEAEAGRFRRDLLYRLEVVRIHIPPLRERPADIPVLAEHCWQTITQRTGSKARLSPATLAELARYHWPGNVRELQNVIASLAVAAPARGWVRPHLLPSIIGAAATVSSGRLAEARTQFERRFIEVALARAGGNRARAARALGLSRQGLLKILARLHLDGSGALETC